METIKARYPVRNDFADRSTGSQNGTYYGTKGHAINAFDMELLNYGLCLDPNDLADFHGGIGRKIIDVHNKFGKVVGSAVLSWYRMPSGTYEFIGYLA